MAMGLSPRHLPVHSGQHNLPFGCCRANGAMCFVGKSSLVSEELLEQEAKFMILIGPVEQVSPPGNVDLVIDPRKKKFYVLLCNNKLGAVGL